MPTILAIWGPLFHLLRIQGGLGVVAAALLRVAEANPIDPMDASKVVVSFLIGVRFIVFNLLGVLASLIIGGGRSHLA